MIRPATFANFYDVLNNPSSGGMGHNMNVCSQNNIPVIDGNRSGSLVQMARRIADFATFSDKLEEINV
ncbi:MAG: hypothetical protein PHO93_03555 [Candidatus Saccharimonadaceae bacterium]|nr:hypothetical protein [Candidatus Saccharimonadaceae bacterium]